jgi:hypothetical protein
MSSVVLYHTGKASYNPKEQKYYDPWESHIWLCLQQIRRWNPTISVYMITDDIDSIPNKERFAELNVHVELLKDLTPRYNIHSLDYFINDFNPTPRSCAFRYFYIEEVIKKHKLTNVFTFDNDVLLFCELATIENKLSSIYKVGITSEATNAFILGMMFIKDYESLVEINDAFWKTMNDEQGKLLTDMYIWMNVSHELGSSKLTKLPSWVSGGDGYSDMHKIVGGIFDPSSIGQHLLGCDNGNPAGCLFPHHVIHQRLSQEPNRWKFISDNDEKERKQYFVYDNLTKSKTKILSIHVHCKRLLELM